MEVAIVNTFKKIKILDFVPQNLFLIDTWVSKSIFREFD